MSTSRTLGSALALTALVATAAQGQDPRDATLEGLVVDSITGRAVAGVLVRMDTGPETLSDAVGRFRLIGLAPGGHVVALLTDDCRVAWTEVRLRSGEVTEVEVRVAAPLGAQEAREIEEADRRRAEGRVVTAEEIDRMNAVSLADVIRRVEPTMIGSPSGYIGAPSAVTGRSRSSLSSPSGKHEPVLVLDGVRVADPSSVLLTIHPSEVATLELQPSAAGGWEFGSAGSGGVIRVTTRSGRGVRSVGGVDACVVPSFPRGR